MSNIDTCVLTEEIALMSDETNDLLCEFPEITQDWDIEDELAVKEHVSPLSSNSFGNKELHEVSLMDSSRSTISTKLPDDWKTEGFSIEPTPINPFGAINVVQKVDLSYNSMPHALFSNLSEILNFSKPQEKEGSPLLPLNSSGIASGVPSTIAFPAPLKKKKGPSIKRAVSASSSSSSSSCSDKKAGSDRWYDRFEDLKVFVQTNGHCHVPINYKPNLPLSQWTKRQRYQWKLKQDGKPSSLTDEREQLLEDLGFLWDVRHVIWDTRYRELVQFHKINGHCNVSIGYETYPKLGTWVKCQRRQYQLMKTGQKSHMTPVRVQQLNELGFVWKGKAAARK